MTEFKTFYKLNDSSMVYSTIIGVSLVFSLLMGVVLGAAGIGVKDMPEWLNYVMNILLYVLFFGAFVLYNKLNKINIIKANELNKKVNFGIIGICVAISIVCIFCFNGFIGLVDFGLDYIKPSSQVTLGTSWWSIICVIITLTILPAIVEEFVFRGAIFKGLLSRFKPVVAIVLSALMFALFHFDIHQFVYQFMLGIIFACIVYYSGSIVYSMIAHFLNNFIVVFMAYLSPLIFGEATAEAVWGAGEVALAIGLAIAGSAIIVGLIFAIRKLSKSKSEQQLQPEVQEQTPDLSPSAEKTTMPQALGQRDSLGGFVGVVVVVGLLWILFAVV